MESTISVYGNIIDDDYIYENDVNITRIGVSNEVQILIINNKLI